MQNKSRIYISNFSNVDGAKPTGGSTLKSLSLSSVSVPAPTKYTTTTTNKPSTYIPPPVVMAPPPTVIPVVPVLAPPSIGGGGGGGGDEKAADTVTGKILGGHAMEIWGFSGLAVLAGAVGGYFLAKHYKKNKTLFASIGGVALGLATYGVTTVFVYPKEQKSGFLGLGKKRHTNKYSSGNTGRADCVASGGTVLFPNSGGWICDKAK